MAGGEFTRRSQHSRSLQDQDQLGAPQSSKRWHTPATTQEVATAMSHVVPRSYHKIRNIKAYIPIVHV
jgi:hypothetical protein